MAWEATRLLPLVLLVLLASGSWEQQVQKLEGEELFVTCQYRPQKSSKTKTWCRIIPAGTCDSLVTHPRLRGQPGDPRYLIMDYPQQRYFTVTMAALREKDSGLYECGTLESSIVIPLRTILLLVSPGESFPSVCASQVP
ncbi:natural cytotoxicity triggering receptor 2-like [Pipistrellus kuhlii]|uniref:natural cytotoxicity triggering receptor 2-like n=1 Tax=Pipistrellus kuhlii TaxID=59472 RepID=UPI00174F706D|nr:natural cytotoxicity triggering receptor 2-like [Pipistrellus kuhlii]